MKEILITKENSNQRIDKFIRKFLNEAPLSLIYKTFRKKDIKINGKPVKENYILCEGDVLRVYISDEKINEFNKPKDISKINCSLNIIYEDQNILIVFKPKGILTHGDGTEKRMTLSNQVLSYLYNKGEFKNDGSSFTPSPCHRLDRNTSGLVIFAKNVISSQIIMEKLKTHEEITKKYLLLVKGQTEKSGEIDAPLKKDESSGFVKVASLNNGGKSAKTIYKTLSFSSDYSLVEATLVSGRTHQLRVHFSYIKHPIVADSKYGDFALNKKFNAKYDYDSQFLHAYKLIFNIKDGELDYLNGKEFIAPLSKKEKNILDDLGLKLL